MWALITGASTGLGKEYGLQLAAKGFNCVLVARNEEGLKSVAKELEDRFKVATKVVCADLSVGGAVDQVIKACEGIDVHTLVNNAGYAQQGTFLEEPRVSHRGIMECMVLAVIELSHHFLPKMMASKAGAIINIASIAAFIDIPMKNRKPRSMYGPIKRFVMQFTKNIALIGKDHGVNIQALCPGLTRTSFHKRCGENKLYTSTPSWLWMSSEEVVALSLEKLPKGKVVVVPGWINKLAVIVLKQFRGIYG